METPATDCDITPGEGLMCVNINRRAQAGPWAPDLGAQLGAGSRAAAGQSPQQACRHDTDRRTIFPSSSRKTMTRETSAFPRSSW